jgi:CheY-like chemotaxis protein
MSKKVLVVDDEPDVVTYLTLVLEQHGFTPVAATSADQAIELVRAERPDVVCLDIMMPKRTGFSFYSALRQMNGGADIPVVVVSGIVQAGEFDFRQFVPDKSIPPPEHYVEKPIEVPKFVELLERLTAGKQKRARRK